MSEEMTVAPINTTSTEIETKEVHEPDAKVIDASAEPEAASTEPEAKSTIVDLPNTPIGEPLPSEQKRGKYSSLTDEEQKECDEHLDTIANGVHTTLAVALAMLALHRKWLLRQTAEFISLKGNFASYMVKKFDFQRSYIFVMLKAARIYTDLSNYLSQEDLPTRINALITLDGYSIKMAVTAINWARKLHPSARHITSSMISNGLEKCPEYQKMVTEKEREKKRREVTELNMEKFRSGLKELKDGVKALYYMNPSDIPVDAYVDKNENGEKEFVHEVELRIVYDEIDRALQYFEAHRRKGEEYKQDLKVQRKKIWDENGKFILFEKQTLQDKWEQKDGGSSTEEGGTPSNDTEGDDHGNA